jgi:excisionase family DNA binding protein
MTAPAKPALAYTVEEAATALGLGVSTIRALMKQGKLIPSYVGKKPLLSKTELERFLHDQPAEPTK